MGRPNGTTGAFAPEHKSLVEALWLAGQSAAEISKHPTFAGKRTRASIIGIVGRLGLLGAKRAPSAPRARATSRPTRPNGERTRVAPRPPERTKPFAAPPVGGVTLLELRDGLCKFPIGAATGADQRFCGAEVDGRFCDAHARVAFLHPASARGDAARPSDGHPQQPAA